ncbi:MAG: DUF86 domain-containing protein [Flavobacteriaceae bacterium]|nr:DUF86 domain-containing protein [Flavobacteriaceae bacterium]MCY4268033.1 DUF86 domain-containing protein [Flavobacteriaceae bacterium]
MKHQKTRNKDYYRLKHIQNSISKIMELKQDVANDEELAEDWKIHSGVLYYLEIIGEASHHLSKEIKKVNPHINWKKLYDSRNFIAHQYFRVNFEQLYMEINTE